MVQLHGDLDVLLNFSVRWANKFSTWLTAANVGFCHFQPRVLTNSDCCWGRLEMRTDLAAWAPRQTRFHLEQRRCGGKPRQTQHPSCILAKSIAHVTTANKSRRGGTGQSPDVIWKNYLLGAKLKVHWVSFIVFFPWNASYSIPIFFPHSVQFSGSVMSDSFQPYGLQLAKLLYPWKFPGKNTGVGCHFLLQGIFLTQGSNPCLLDLLHCRQILYSLSHLGSPLQFMNVSDQHTISIQCYGSTISQWSWKKDERKDGREGRHFVIEKRGFSHWKIKDIGARTK